ncbi:hypothetical protein KFE25_009277 [Diacronema lutheri]|uniref:G-protein coupled receptors family 1 profile domain-containing protein n=3 Tax=Diacronema lutheri TaxID=2081491 RepID=A0A8J6CH71_DIALT|nr:hypothetical protein KFE25_009277 [Diacronema lutheri]
MPYAPVLDFKGEELAQAARGEYPASERLGIAEARWLLIRAPLPDAIRVEYWRAWVFITAASSVASILVIALVLSRRRLREQPFNHFIVGLVVPDLIFSFACIFTCAKHVGYGDMWDGHGHYWCDLQSGYTLFGAVGSMWVNVLITREVSRLAACTRDMVTFKPTPIREIWKGLCLLFSATALFSAFVVFTYRVFPSFPSRSHAVRGLNCMPVEYDLPSRAFFYGVTMNVALFLPLALIGWFALRIWADTVHDDALEQGRAQRRIGGDVARMISRVVAMRRRSHDVVASGEPQSTTHDAWPAAVPLTVSVQAVAALTAYFMRLLLVIGVMWSPFFLIWMVQVPYYMLGGHLTWFSGSWAHLQGLVSAIVYLRKNDMRDELQLIISGGAGGWRLWQSHDVAQPRGSAHSAARHKAPRGTADWDELERRWPTAVTEVLPAQNIAIATINASRSGGHGAAAGDDGPEVVSLAAQVLALARSTRDAIHSREQLPMVVVPWETWARAGRIPSHAEGLAEPVLADGQHVVFISHRWWRDDHPDDEHGTKYAFIAQGVRRIAQLHSLPLERMAIWLDFACIDQVDPELQNAGIASLISYAVRSSYVLVPVEPSEISHASLKAAAHPMDINNYGERAWCRCEIFVFLCLAEMCDVDTSVYAFGALPPVGERRDSQHAHVLGNGSVGVDTLLGAAHCAPSATSSDASPSESDVGDAGAAAGQARPFWRSARAVRAQSDAIELGAVAHSGDPATAALPSARATHQRPSIWPRRQGGAARTLPADAAVNWNGGRDVIFKALHEAGSRTGNSARARFKSTELPSNGLLTIESDREHIRELERDIRRSFVRFKLLREKVLSASPARGHGHAFRLDHAMVRNEDVQLICRDVLLEPYARTLGTLSLQGNQIGAHGAATLMRSLVCVPGTPSLTALELSRNVDLGLAGVQAIALALSHESCTLRRLLLDRCALEPPAGYALARGLMGTRTLELLDVSGNRLSDASVVSLHESSIAGGRARITLVIDGNPLSRAVFQMAEVGHLSAAGLHGHRSSKYTHT